MEVTLTMIKFVDKGVKLKLIASLHLVLDGAHRDNGCEYNCSIGEVTKPVLDFLDLPPFLSNFKLLYCRLIKKSMVLADQVQTLPLGDWFII